MTEKKSKIEKAEASGKVDRYGITKKTAYSAAGLFGCLGAIVVLSITQAAFDPSKIIKWSFWVGMAISYAISIFSMITGRQMGDDMSRNNPNGQFRVELRKYVEVYQSLDNGLYFAYFADWLEVYRERKKAKRIREFLRDQGIYQYEVLDLDKSEIGNLSKPWRKSWEGTGHIHVDSKTGNNETFFKSLTEEQIDALGFVLSGGIKVGVIEEAFFKNALTQDTKDMWDSAIRADKKKGLYIGSNYAYKLIAMLAWNVVWSSLVPALAEDVSQAQVWIDMIGRIATMVVSSLFGIFLGWKVVDIDREYLSFKTATLKEYKLDSDNGIFVFESTEDKARREYSEYESSLLAEGGTENEQQ